MGNVPVVSVSSREVAGARALPASTSALRRIALLAEVPEPILRELSRRCTWRRFDRRQRIVSSDAQDDDVYLIVAGVVRVTAFSASGRELIYRDLRQGEWFGDLAAIDRRVRSADVVAVSETLLVSLRREDFVRLLAENRHMADAELRHLIAWIRTLSERLFDLSTLGVRNRVHAELLRYATEAGVIDNVARIRPAPRHTEIASRISTYREQVTRALSRLAEESVIAREGESLVVLDVARLERMVAEARLTG